MTDYRYDTTAVILSCRGGNQGELGLVRSLGREHVNIVFITENREAHSLYSKFVTKTIFVDSFSNDAEEVIRKLIDYAAQCGHKPVLFPSADPDLELISQHRDRLKDHYLFTMPSQEVVATCLDKSRFFDYGKEKSFPLPKTFTPSNLDDLEEMASAIEYPVILKPLNPKSWAKPHIKQLVNQKKALVIGSKEELIDRYQQIMVYDGDMVLQEYIPGRDDRLYSVHVHMGRSGEALGYFVGRKIRTYPAYAGIGCFVISEYHQELVDISIDILKKMDYFGLALLQFKRHEKNGSYILLEINARTSSWNQLPLYCGVNLPYIAYLDVTDQPLPAISPQVNGIKYIYFKPDLIALREYRKTGDWTLSGWATSYWGKKTYQVFSYDDPYPFFKVVTNDLRDYLRKKFGK